MDKIGQILDSKDVDWTLCENTGLHIINSQDYDEGLLTDISTQSKTPMNSLDYGTFVVICPKEQSQHAAGLMKSLGYSLKPKDSDAPITPSNPKTGDDLLNEVAEALDSEKLFKQFGKAMTVLGEQLGIGPIQNKLKERGITWRMGDDNDSIIFQVDNSVTGEPQPVARISKESLNTQNDFQKQLTNVLDFAMGNSPGTFDQQKEKINKQQQMVQDVSRVVFPNDESSKIASLMLSD
jgi:hypothetical protein